MALEVARAHRSRQPLKAAATRPYPNRGDTRGYEAARSYHDLVVNRVQGDTQRPETTRQMAHSNNGGIAPSGFDPRARYRPACGRIDPRRGLLGAERGQLRLVQQALARPTL